MIFTILTIPIQGDPHGAQAVDAVRELRDELIPEAFPDATVDVAGDTAESIDESDTMSDWPSIVLAFTPGSASCC